VLSTRIDDLDREHLMRRRECVDCLARWFTIELRDHESPVCLPPHKAGRRPAVEIEEEDDGTVQE